MSQNQMQQPFNHLWLFTKKEKSLVNSPSRRTPIMPVPVTFHSVTAREFEEIRRQWAEAEKDEAEGKESGQAEENGTEVPK